MEATTRVTERGQTGEHLPNASVYVKIPEQAKLICRDRRQMAGCLGPGSDVETGCKSV